MVKMGMSCDKEIIYRNIQVDYDSATGSYKKEGRPKVRWVDKININSYLGLQKEEKSY